SHEDPEIHVQEKFEELEKYRVQQLPKFKDIIVGRTEEAKEHYETNPKTDGDIDARYLRDKRDVIGPINDAMNNEGGADNATANCALTSLGAFAAKNSTDALRWWCELQNPKVDPKAAANKSGGALKLEGFQNQGVWYKIESGRYDEEF